MTEAVPTAHTRRRFDRIAELAKPLDVGPDRAGAHFEPRRQVLSRPVAARLQHREQLEQARRCLPHKASVWQQSRNEVFRNCFSVVSMTTATAPQPFTIEITDSELQDLHRRLDATRWPDPAPDARTDFARGVPLAYLQELTTYWRQGFDWRAQEARLNQIPQFTTEIDGQQIHYLHVRSPSPMRCRC